MKERMFSTGLPLKTPLLLLGIFLVLAVAFHPTTVAAQLTIHCYKLQGECIKKCYSNFDEKASGESKERNYGCGYGCLYFEELCRKYVGWMIMASAQEEMFLAEATLRVFEEAMER